MIEIKEIFESEKDDMIFVCIEDTDIVYQSYERQKCLEYVNERSIQGDDYSLAHIDHRNLSSHHVSQKDESMMQPSMGDISIYWEPESGWLDISYRETVCRFVQWYN